MLFFCVIGMAKFCTVWKVHRRAWECKEHKKTLPGGNHCSQTFRAERRKAHGAGVMANIWGTVFYLLFLYKDIFRYNRTGLLTCIEVLSRHWNKTLWSIHVIPPYYL